LARSISRRLMRRHQSARMRSSWQSHITTAEYLSRLSCMAAFSYDRRSQYRLALVGILHILFIVGKLGFTPLLNSCRTAPWPGGCAGQGSSPWRLLPRAHEEEAVALHSCRDRIGIGTEKHGLATVSCSPRRVVGGQVVTGSIRGECPHAWYGHRYEYVDLHSGATVIKP
jgi:hypothetical protein